MGKYMKLIVCVCMGSFVYYSTTTVYLHTHFGCLLSFFSLSEYLRGTQAISFQTALKSWFL